MAKAADDDLAQPIHIAIIGGGIGGLALLLGILHHADPAVIKPHLYEAAAAFSEIGAGVGFGPNSVKAMSLVSPALHEAYWRIAVPAEVANDDTGRERRVWNEFRMGMDGQNRSSTTSNDLKAGDFITMVLNDNPKKNVHRAKFLDAMIRLLPGASGEGFVSLNKRCAGVDELDKETGTLTVHFEDGTSVQAHAVVGSDGVKSRIRKIVLDGIGDHAAVCPNFTGKYAYRGLIPMADAITSIGEVARRSHMVLGYGGHLVLFPVDLGATLNVVAFQTKADGKWENEQWVVPATISEVLDDFRAWSNPIKNLLSKLQRPDKWMLFDHPPSKSYLSKDGRVVLLGDGAHSSSPHSGAGAGMAIEDAAVLSRLLGALEASSADKMLPRAFQAYDAVRRPRSQRLVTASRDGGELYDFQKEGIGDDVELLRRNLKERMGWIWDLNLNRHCDEAIRLMTG